MIPTFPEFKKLELSDKQEFENITAKFLPYSDYNFVSLWSFNTQDDFLISQLNSNIIVRFRDYLTHDMFYSFMGNSSLVSTISTLLALAKESGVNPQLKLIPEEVISGNTEVNEKFIVTEDRDQFDYVLSIPELVSLSGSKYSLYRKLISRFNRRSSNSKVVILDINKADVQAEVIKLFNVWEMEKNRSRDETQHELIAIQRLLKDSGVFKMFCLGVYEGSELIAFLIANLEHDKWVEGDFLKAKPSFSGMVHILHHYLAQELSKEGYDFINIECDLGIENLRVTKEQSKPIKFLKKYTISEKD